jgi:dolichol-phosphate mannosyltransferase
VRLLRRTAKSGRGDAVMAGFRAGLEREQYGQFAEMDADLSHEPEALPDLMAAATGADVVVGSRYVNGGRIQGWGAHRRAWSWLSNRIIAVVLRTPIADNTNGFRLYSRAAVETLASATLREKGFIALSEWTFVLARAGYRFADVPVLFTDRTRGTSNMSAAEAVGALRALVRLRMRPRR